MGSSSSRRSGSRNSTPASATRMRQPPEKDESGWAWAVVVEAQPFRMRAARAGAASAPISISRLCSSAMRTGSAAALASASSAVAHGVGREHGLQRRQVAARRLLAHHADPQGGGHAHLARVGLQLARDQPQQRGLAGAVAADQGHPGGGRDAQVCALEQGAAGDAQGDVGEVQHGGRWIAWTG